VYFFSIYEKSFPGKIYFAMAFSPGCLEIRKASFFLALLFGACSSNKRILCQNEKIRRAIAVMIIRYCFVDIILYGMGSWNILNVEEKPLLL
jgi:hypothetical protein